MITTRFTKICARLPIVGLGLLAVTALAGCAKAAPPAMPASEPYLSEQREQDGQSISFQDDADRSIGLPQRPQRIVVLSPQLLNLLYDVGGTAIARTTSASAAVPEEAEQLQEVGGITTVNTEKLLALKPDLVIGSTSFHRDLAGLLDRSQVPFALFELGTYGDLKEKAALFGRLAGTERRAEEALSRLDQAIRELTVKVPADRAPTFIMLNVTPNSISVQRQNTVGLEVAAMLNMKNAAESLESADRPSTAPFSLEKIVELDPDYIFLLIHGVKAEGESKIRSDLAANPAWASLRAVKENRTAILPSDLLLSNPGFRLNESVEYLAKLVYPDVYGHAR